MGSFSEEKQLVMVGRHRGKMSAHAPLRTHLIDLIRAYERFVFEFIRR